MSDVFPGKDNHVRAAKVQIGDQEYIRPISKLCLFECKDLERVDKPEFIKEGERTIIRKYDDNETLHK